METLFKQQDIRGTPLSISATSVPGNSKPGLELLRFATVAPIPSFHHRTPISSSIFGFRVRDFSSLKRPAAQKSLKTRSFPGFDAPTIHISEIGSDQDQKWNWDVLPFFGTIHKYSLSRGETVMSSKLSLPYLQCIWYNQNGNFI